MRGERIAVLHFTETGKRYDREAREAVLRKEVFAEFMAGRLNTPDAMDFMQTYICRRLRVRQAEARAFLAATLGLEEETN